MTAEAGMQSLVALEKAGAITRTGLIITKLHELTLEEWEMLGRGLAQAGNAIDWAEIDWLNHGEDLFGEEFFQIADSSRIAKQTRANRASLGRKVPRSRRRPGLTVSHHDEVKALEPADQKRWLAEAERQEMTCSTLRRAIKAERTGKTEPEVVCRCSACGHEHSPT